jgi:urease accessory protein
MRGTAIPWRIWLTRTIPVTLMVDTSLYQLLTWGSPSYPTGAFSYSHGLEWAVEVGAVKDLQSLQEYIEAVLSRGAGWIDAVLFAHAWRVAAQRGACSELDEIAELAAALRGGAEAALESRQQGNAFLQVTRKAWAHPLLEEFAGRSRDRATAHCVAVAVASAAHGVELRPALAAYLHAFAGNLVSAGSRLIPLGQTDSQIAVARLAPCIFASIDRALAAQLEELGTAAPMLELMSLRHETQYTRLFRS